MPLKPGVRVKQPKEVKQPKGSARVDEIQISQNAPRAEEQVNSSHQVGKNVECQSPFTASLPPS
ncbi:hypothetical protein PIB30_077949 [Stylosanthes scabra]|uniref:Uncharacterized protein n=1 Tax=Stylosanthes scabra TaxID=79078 RepID=A0ABU6RR97_9FABA|nr:hypothetical protein [Stylosanthes scabra]